MLEKFIELRDKIFREENVEKEVDELLNLLLCAPQIEEIVIFKGLVNLTGDRELKNKVSKITNLIKFPLKKVRAVES